MNRKVDRCSSPPPPHEPPKSKNFARPLARRISLFAYLSCRLLLYICTHVFVCVYSIYKYTYTSIMRMHLYAFRAIMVLRCFFFEIFLFNFLPWNDDRGDCFRVARSKICFENRPVLRSREQTSRESDCERKKRMEEKTIVKQGSFIDRVFLRRRLGRNRESFIVPCYSRGKRERERDRRNNKKFPTLYPQTPHAPHKL